MGHSATDCPCSLHECCFCFDGYSPTNTYVLLSPTTTAHVGCLDTWREFYPPHAAALKVVRDEMDSLRNFGPNEGGDPRA